jgi:hypothetical protein
MRKYRAVWLVAFVLLASSATLAADAGAEVTPPAQWLANGETITSALAAASEGEVVLEDVKEKVGITCDMSLNGTVGPKSEDQVTVVLNLSGTEVTLTVPLKCKAHKTCEENTDVEFAPEKLPWSGIVELTEAGVFKNVLTEASYSASCLILGIKISEECTITNSSHEILNVTGGVESVGPSSPDGTCTLGGSNAGEIQFLSGFLTLLTGAGSLTVSGGPLAEDIKGTTVNFGKAKKVEENIVVEIQILTNAVVTFGESMITPVEGNAFTPLQKCRKAVRGRNGECVEEVLFEPPAAGKYKSILEIEVSENAGPAKEILQFTLVGEA